MSIKRNFGALVAGSLLILFGLLALVGQIFRGFSLWGMLWPFFIIAFGGLFFAGMFAGGKSMAGLAIPGSIFTGLGLMMLVQNLTNYWQSWSYSWTVILVLVGVGVFIMGLYTDDAHRREAGLRIMKVGAILFVIFGGFFELIFSAFRQNSFVQIAFPVLLVLLGIYLVISRSGLLSAKRTGAADEPVNSNPESK